MQFQTAIPSRFRPHLFTIVMVVAVGTAATFSQLISRGGMISCGQIPIQEENYGWPMRSHHRVETFLPQGMQVQQEWHTFGIIVDVIASLIVIGSTCFVSERWLLKIPRQFRLIHLFALLTVAAIAFFVFVDEKTLLVLQVEVKTRVYTARFR